MCACVHISKIITVCFSHSTLKPLLCTQATQVSLHTVWVCVCVLGSNRYTHTYMPILKKKKTCSRGSEHDASTPIAHNQRCHTRVKYIKLLRNSTEKKKDKKLPEPSEADGVSQYQRTGCVCLPVSVSAPDSRRKTTRRTEKKKKKGLRFHSDPRNEITNPIITRMLHGSPANRLRWVIYLMLFFFLLFF